MKKTIKETMKFSVKFALVITVLVLLLNLIPKESRRIKKSNSVSHHIEQINITNGQKTQAQIYNRSLEWNLQSPFLRKLGER
jgi:hypothetical protein